MTAGVALADLRPGDEILDLIAAGTVADVQTIPAHTKATKVTFTDGTFLAGPSGHTVVVTNREAADR